MADTTVVFRVNFAEMNFFLSLKMQAKALIIVNV
jgi:hypothetical protein